MARVLAQEIQDWKVCGPTETIERISVVARDGRNTQHLKALELLLRVHGLLSDKLDVKVERGDLLKQVTHEIERIRSSSRAQLVYLSTTSDNKHSVR
jgi:hypothetical protein